VSKQPTPAEIKEFLLLNGSPLPEADGKIELWRISDRTYSHKGALQIAELCLLTGQPLSAICTTEMFLNMAQRITELEKKLAAAENADKMKGRTGW